jgi:hypothetical protein
MMTDYECHECGSTDVSFDAAGLPDGAYEFHCFGCGYELYVPAEVKAKNRIAKLRKIRSTSSAGRVDGYLVDIVTAGLLVAVFDALSPANREKFGTVNLAKLVELAWMSARVAS